MQCVLLLGGLGTRMSSLTNNKIPKCMVEINRLPFIDYQLQHLTASGIKNFVFCVSHLKEKIKDYVGDGSKWNAFVNYVDDGEIQLGTGGAIRKAYEEFQLYDNFMVMYGDSFLPIDFTTIYHYYISQPFHALMTVYKNNNNFDRSNADFENGLVRYNKENPPVNYQYIDYGLSILTRDLVEKFIPPGKKYDLSSMFMELSQKSMLGGYEIHDRFYEVGSPSGLVEFQKMLQNEKSLYNNS